MFSRRDFSLAASAGVLLGGCAGAGSRPDTPAEPAAPSPLSEIMQGTAVPGMAALVIRNFGIETQYISGIRVLGSPAMIAPNDRWHQGSNGKAMTATLIAKLVDAGILSWERPLSQMLPEFAANTQPAYRDVTLPDLLSHRAGLPENTSDMDFFFTFHTDPTPLPEQRLRYISRCLQEAPVGPARAESVYSNTGFLIAAACAERATGQTFEDLIVRHVFEPLGIQSISFDQFGAPNEPQGHVDGRIANQQNDVNPRMFAPAGAMRMTLPDWARFASIRCKASMAGVVCCGERLTLSCMPLRVRHALRLAGAPRQTRWAYAVRR